MSETQFLLMLVVQIQMLVVESQIRMFIINIYILERKSRMMFHMLRMFQIETLKHP